MTTIESSNSRDNVALPGQEFPVGNITSEWWSVCRFAMTLSWEFTDRLYRKATIGALPYHVLLDIFNFLVHVPQPHYPFSNPSGAILDAWHTLLHVCRRWRHVVLGSPRSLDLKLHCTNRTPVRTMLDIWPACPIVVFCHRSPGFTLRGVRNVIAALKCCDRVCEIRLWGVQKSLLKRFAVLNASFPELKSVQLSLADDGNSPAVLSDSFLGGFAPRLQSLDLYGISFPHPQKLLLSTKDLVTLRLEDIPSSGYISPEEMASCLSGLTKLEQVALGFRSIQAGISLHPEYMRQHPPLHSHCVLPALTSLRFRGRRNYFEALISRIGVPPLEDLDITFFFHIEDNAMILQLHEFINRIEGLEAPHRADIAIDNQSVQVTISRPEGMVNRGTLKVGMLSKRADDQLSYLVHFCKSSLLPLSTLEHLHLHGSFPRSPHYLLETFRWSDVFLPFTSVKNLHVSKELAIGVSDALQQSAAERVLPALQNIFLPGSQPSGALLQANTQLAANRQHSGRPVSVHY